MKMNEEEERVTLENFMDSAILERLLNETEEDKDIIHTINRESHTFLCKFEDNLLSEPPLHYYLHPLLVQLSPNCTKKYAISYTFQIKYWVKIKLHNKFHVFYNFYSLTLCTPRAT